MNAESNLAKNDYASWRLIREFSRQCNSSRGISVSLLSEGFVTHIHSKTSFKVVAQDRNK